MGAGGRTEMVERERRFWDTRHRSRYDVLRARLERAIGHFARYDHIRTLYDPRDKVVLDYGCGPGHTSVDLLRHGARRVIGIDISEAEVAEARERAVRAGFGDRSEFMVADAHATGLPGDSLDLVVGASVLHHLELEPALRELRRVLRPGGTAVFHEPLWHNPLMRLGRALTPSGRTADEHPLTAEDWELCARIFPGFTHVEREFLTVPLMPLNFVLPDAAQRRLAAWVGPLDDRLLERFPRLRKHARITFLVLR
jgi:SAM-dependent methyltransferase